MPFLMDQVLFLLVLVDLRQAYFPLHPYHSVTFPSFIYTKCCNPSSSSSLHSKEWLDSSECKPQGLDASSFFSSPVEGCNFAKIVRHLYEQKREVAPNTFEFSIWGINFVEKVSVQTRLRPPMNNFFQLLIKSIPVCTIAGGRGKG